MFCRKNVYEKYADFVEMSLCHIIQRANHMNSVITFCLIVMNDPLELGI
jgi:hypothetical protein